MRKGRRNAMKYRLDKNIPKTRIHPDDRMTGATIRLGDKKEYVVLPNGAWKRIK